MKLYKKLDLYLLEHHPLLWHSKIHLLLIIGLILNSSFYLMGYFHATVDNLQDKNILNYYFVSAVFLHILAIICSLTIWALFFFRNNALKSNYRIQRFYISKLILIISFGFFVLTLPYITFQKGILQATRNYEEVEQLNNDIKEYNKAKYFLVTNSQNFHLEYATFPIPLYRYETVEDDKNTQEDRFQSGFSQFKDSIYIPEIHPENTFKIDEKEIQFYLEDHKILWKDKCDTEYETYISKILNPKTIKSDNYYSCEHFSGDLLIPININLKYYKNQYDNSISACGNEYSKKVFELIKNKDKEQLFSLIKNFKSILIKHKIKHQLDVKAYTNYLIQSNFSANKTLIFDYKPYNSNTTTPNFINPDFTNSKTINAYFFNESDFNQLIENCYTANTYKFDLIVYWVLFLICFIASIIIIAFEIFPIIQLFISISLFGVLIIGNVFLQVIIQYSISYSYGHRELYVLIHSIIVIFLCLIYAIISQNWKGKKWLTTQLSLFGLFVVGGFIPILIIFLDQLLSYYTFTECNQRVKIYSIFHPFTNGFPISIAFFISIILYTKILKKYLSKKE